MVGEMVTFLQCQSFQKVLLDVNWLDIFANQNAESCWLRFKKILCTNIDKFVPKMKCKSSFKNPPIWMSKDVKSAIKMKKNAWRK